ncbi:MAG: 50S ribosomal protein L19 [Candidatus Omnitrophica bacterium]|nr:50S ribosomal protein L19 [Candidatus Omnitrophota bacterium]
MKKAIELIEKDSLKKDVAKFQVGDKVRVFQRIQEGDKSRLQAFEGIVIRRRGRGTGATFTVLRSDRAYSVEKIFPVHSPLVDKVVVLQSSGKKLKRAKLYSLRAKAEEA